MKHDKIVLYMHAGSDNHGSEAIAGCLCRMLPRPAVLITSRKAEDDRYSLPGLCAEIIEERHVEASLPVHAFYYIRKHFLHDPESYMRYRYRAVCGKRLHALNISIGGDNYCYENMLERLIMSNRMFHRQGAKTLLYGCSIEPELIKRPDIAEDLRLYDAVVARESITWEALRQVLPPERLFLYPDPAFLLETEYLPLPAGWKENKTVGLNISPMIVENEKKAGVVMENYAALLSHILEQTDFSVALIPHVVWKGGDDRKPLRSLYERFAGTGRVVLVEDASAAELKGFIARCRFFVGARTHATIAAYSSCVPTLAAGYSVKARGIAKDLFGSDEHYVITVQQMEKREELVRAFEWLLERETSVRDRLQQVMPEYRERAKKGADVIRALCGE